MSDLITATTKRIGHAVYRRGQHVEHAIERHDSAGFALCGAKIRYRLGIKSFPQPEPSRICAKCKRLAVSDGGKDRP